MRRRLVALSLLVAGAFGALALLRRSRVRTAERVEILYADGVRIMLTDVDAAPLLVHARDALRTE
jgi:hypothetical protein